MPPRFHAPSKAPQLALQPVWPLNLLLPGAESYGGLSQHAMIDFDCIIQLTECQPVDLLGNCRVHG